MELIGGQGGPATRKATRSHWVTSARSKFPLPGPMQNQGWQQFTVNVKGVDDLKIIKLHLSSQLPVRPCQCTEEPAALPFLKLGALEPYGSKRVLENRRGPKMDVLQARLVKQLRCKILRLGMPGILCDVEA